MIYKQIQRINMFQSSLLSILSFLSQQAQLVFIMTGWTIEVASVIELSEASGQVAAGLFIYPPTIDTLVTGMGAPSTCE